MLTISKICTIEDVGNFTRQLVAEGTNVHPDDDFSNYINSETGEDSYGPTEAAIRNTDE